MCIAGFRVLPCLVSFDWVVFGVVGFLVLGCCALLFFAWLFDDSGCVCLGCLLTSLVCFGLRCVCGFGWCGFVLCWVLLWV